MWTAHTLHYSVTASPSAARGGTDAITRQHVAGTYELVSERGLPPGARSLAGTSPYLAGYSEARHRLEQQYHGSPIPAKQDSFLLWAVAKVQGAIQATVICFVAVCMFPLVVAGAVFTLLASVMVHYLMSGYNGFNDGVPQRSTPASEYAPPHRFRWQLPGRLRSAWDSDYSSSSDEEDDTASRRVHRLRTRIGARMTALRRRLTGRSRQSDGGSDSSDSEGGSLTQQRRSQAWAARMRRMRNTFQASMGSFVASCGNSESEEDSPAPSPTPLRKRKSMKDMLQLVLKDEGFLYGLLSELPGVDITSAPIRNAIERMKDSVQN
mmetsp:Transcript_18847/g.52590  ORF Transcript_18847/g.52590 Transcript_18847/m.52590 type:complete len:323 (+) Transcript_18847:608-1576(+)|eukprot:CAMPEP_0117669342 /NCGR_PEP_ID=MMETSP0804-20121206/12077_1 /TAXON_ID=1074897 /ORGANISM="Tetraselmis astigmatica, Strain CCMP880" /LENGTH=322 /DNA_ID=CAMNT_0005477385 /DNA_START=594 /DNA_END=1562 /DNA_ORIENTATION=+